MIFCISQIGIKKFQVMPPRGGILFDFHRDLLFQLFQVMPPRGGIMYCPLMYFFMRRVSSHAPVRGHRVSRQRISR